MNKEWLEKNRRALIGIGIFATLLILNFAVRLGRPKPAAILLPGIADTQQPAFPPGTSPAPSSVSIPVMTDPTQPIAMQLSGVSARLAELESRLATVPTPITRLLPEETISPPDHDLFHWPGTVPIASWTSSATGSAQIASSSSPALPLTSAPQQIVFLGSFTRGNRKFALMRINNRVFLTNEGSYLGNSAFRVKAIGTSSADLESSESGSQTIFFEHSGADKINGIAGWLKNKSPLPGLEMRWIPQNEQASFTNFQKILPAVLTPGTGSR